MNRHASRIWPHDRGLVSCNKRHERRRVRQQLRVRMPRIVWRVAR